MPADHSRDDPPREQRSYRDILTSSAMIGGATALGVAIGVLRTKAFALLLGPAGYGYLGLYASVIELAACAAGVGVGNSAVREVAQGAGAGDTAGVARTGVVVRRLCLVLGVVGAVVLTLLSGPISALTFGDARHAPMVALSSLAVLFQLVQAGRMAVLQGTRRIGELARVQVFSALLGTLAAIGVLAVLREEGPAPALVAFAFTSAGVAWWRTRRMFSHAPRISWAESARGSVPLLQLGVAFMGSAFLVLGAAYAMRSIVAREEGMAAAGLYHTAWTIGSLYVGFILQAMGTDFYPRLVAAIQDERHSNRIVNEQILVSMLLAGPGLVATISFAHVVIYLLYSSQFLGADGILRWICLGMALRAVLWPMGYILVAKNRRVLFLGADLAWSVVVTVLCALLVSRYGVEGAGMAFFAAYVLHGFIVYPMAARLTGFRLSRVNRRTMLALSSCTILVWVAAATLSPGVAMAVGGATTLALAFHALRVLVRLDALPPRLRLLSRLVFLPEVAGASRKAD